MAKKATSPAKSTFRVRTHAAINLNIDVEAKNEREAWKIASRTDRAKWNREESEEEFDEVTLITNRCSCGETMEWDEDDETFECGNCGAIRRGKAGWVTERGRDGFYRVINSQSVVVAEKCKKKDAQLFAAAHVLLKECEINLGNWQMLLNHEWDGSTPGIVCAIERLEAVINQAYGKES
jgi:hypothetical protein